MRLVRLSSARATFALAFAAALAACGGGGPTIPVPGPSCTTSGCPVGQACDPGTKVCVALAGCSTNADCSGGQVCDPGTRACVSSGPLCEAAPFAPFAQVGSTYRRVRFPSGPITIDASASYDLNCDPLTFTWSMTVPEGSATALDTSNPEIVRFTPDRDGPYEVTLSLSDGARTSTASVYVGVHLPATGHSFFPLDADYSASLDRIVVVTSEPALRIIDPAASPATSTVVRLDAYPNAVSVSPDGTRAAVSHYHQFTLVDLVGAAVIRTYAPSIADFTYDGGDVLLYDADWAFAFPLTDISAAPIVVKLSDGTATSGSLNADADSGLHAKPRLDAARDHVFALGTYGREVNRFTAAPGAIAFDILPGATFISHQTGPFLSPDDSRIYTGAGSVISPADLTVSGALTLLAGGDPLPFTHVADSVIAGKVVAVTSDSYGADAFRVYDRDTLQLLERRFHPAMFDIGGIATPSWAFWKADGSRYYVVGYDSAKTGIATYTVP